MIGERNMGYAKVLALVFWVSVVLVSAQNISLSRIENGMANDRLNATAENSVTWSVNGKSDCTLNNCNSTDRLSTGSRRPKRFIQGLMAVGMGLSMVSQGIGIYSQVRDLSRKTSSDEAIQHGFKEAFDSLGRNYKAIANVEESIDRIMSENKYAFSSLDHKIDQRTAETLNAVDGISSKIDVRVAEMLGAMTAIDQNNDQRTSATLSAISNVDEKNARRTAVMFEAINAADKNNHQRTSTILDFITAADRKNDQRTNLTLESVRTADQNSHHRTAATLVAIDAVDRRNDGRTNATLDAIINADRLNNVRTAMTLESIVTADRNNGHRTSLTLDAINATDRNNEQRTAATLEAINGANIRADERTAMMVDVISAADRNNHQRTADTLIAINTADRRSSLRTSATLNALINSDQNNNRRTIAMMAAISDVDKNVGVNFGALLQSIKVASESYQSIEALRFQMHQEFNKVLDFSKKSRIEPTISKLRNFIQYYSSEKQRTNELPRSQRIRTLLDVHGLLPHLRESRTPRGDSLQSFMFEVINQGYAIPKDQNDTVAMSALSALFYGCRTQISVMYYLMQQYLYLADNCYRNQKLEEYNNYIGIVETVFEGFRHSLIGTGSTSGLIDQIIGVVKRVGRLEFVGPAGGNTYTNLMRIVAILELQKSNLLEASLPIISDIPPKLTAQIKFDRSSPSTPIGPWEAGAKVSYAVQYRNKDAWYSKIGEWSSPFKVKGKSNPILRVPANSMYTRLLFRKFNSDHPEFVGVLSNDDQIYFIDIDRDLYNAASNSEEAVGMQEAGILIESGANISAVFDCGRNFLHAAAISNNVELAKAVLSNPNVQFDINAKDNNGYTPLHLAAEAGSVNFISFLLNLGADINAQNIIASTPLHLASASGYTLAVEALIRNNQVNVNAQDNTGASALHRAVMSGVLQNVKTLLSHNQIDNNIKSDGGLSPLHMSSSLVKFPEISEVLLQSYGTSLNLRSDGNLSTLHLATIAGNLPVLQLLSMLDGTDMNPQSVNGWTPLHYAVALQKKDAVFKLLKSGNVIVDVPGKNRITPLHLAATTGQSIVLSELLAHGADLELPTIDGLTAFHLAVVNNNHDAMKILADSGANINAKTANGSTPLHLIATHGHVQSLLCILGMENVKIDLKNDYDQTPLWLAEKHGHKYAVAVLKERIEKTKEPLDLPITGQVKPARPASQPVGMESGTITFRPDSYEMTDKLESSARLTFHTSKSTGNTTASPVEEENMWLLNRREVARLHNGARFDWTGVVQGMLELGVDVDARDAKGYTALHHAAGNGHDKMVELLIHKGANPRATGNDGLTPLVHATFNNHSSVVATLVKLGARVDTTSNLLQGMDAFHVAVICNNSEIASFLAGQGANINARLHEDNTALHFAVKLGNMHNVKLLLEIEGVNVNAKNVHGETPLQIAQKEGVGEIGEKISSLLRTNIDRLNDELISEIGEGFVHTHYSTRRRLASWEKIKSLLKRGAETVARDRRRSDAGATICFLALSGEDPGIAQYFIDNGCDVNSENDVGERALHKVIDTHCSLGAVQLLFKNGANLNAKTNAGDTPLHYAARSSSRYNALRYLIDMGAVVNTKDMLGRKPSDIARENHVSMTEAYLAYHKLRDTLSKQSEIIANRR